MRQAKKKSGSAGRRPSPLQRDTTNHRIHTVWFEDEAMPAWDLSGVSDEFITELHKLHLRESKKLRRIKRGRKVSPRTLEKITQINKLRAENESWRRIARIVYPDVPVRTAEHNLSSLRRRYPSKIVTHPTPPLNSVS
jgi:hypothetical protein